MLSILNEVSNIAKKKNENSGQIMCFGLFNCFNTMGQNVNKQSRILWTTHFQQIYVFRCILTCMDNYIRQFVIFTEVDFSP